VAFNINKITTFHSTRKSALELRGARGTVSHITKG